MRKLISELRPNLCSKPPPLLAWAKSTLTWARPSHDWEMRGRCQLCGLLLISPTFPASDNIYNKSCKKKRQGVLPSTTSCQDARSWAIAPSASRAWRNRACVEVGMGWLDSAMGWLGGNRCRAQIESMMCTSYVPGGGGGAKSK